MCDYSLYAIYNRPAQEGEYLVLHKFETGSLGFASASELTAWQLARTKEAGSFWATIKDWLLLPQRTKRLPAICMPPGARLLLSDVPRKVQTSLCIGSSEIVVFTEAYGQSYSYREALLLPNGTRVLLQDLPEGIHARALGTSPDSSTRYIDAAPQAA